MKNIFQIIENLYDSRRKSSLNQEMSEVFDIVLKLLQQFGEAFRKSEKNVALQQN